MDSVSSRARIFSVSLYLMADLIPRSTLRRSSSLARMASVRSFWIRSARVIAFPRAVEYSRGAKKRINTEDAQFGTQRAQRVFGLFDLARWGRYRCSFTFCEIFVATRDGAGQTNRDEG